MRTSLVNLLGLFIAAFVVAFFLLMLIIWATPLRNYLPGYNEDLRKEFIAQTYRLDSLQQEMELRAVYLNSIRDVVSGNVHTDSLPPLDSLEQKQKEAMLATMKRGKRTTYCCLTRRPPTRCIRFSVLLTV